jgi:hypothetical protein
VELVREYEASEQANADARAARCGAAQLLAFAAVLHPLLEAAVRAIPEIRDADRAPDVARPAAASFAASPRTHTDTLCQVTGAQN